MPIANDPGRTRRVGACGPWALLLLLAAPVGCGGPALSPPVAPDRARASLREALDAWKGGMRHGELAGRAAPIRVADEDWLAGSKLIAYDISTKDQVVGDALRCPVSLALEGRSGNVTRRLVSYNVTTVATPTVIRQD